MAVSAVAASAVDAASVLASFAVVEAVPAAEAAAAAESVPFFCGEKYARQEYCRSRERFYQIFQSAQPFFARFLFSRHKATIVIRMCITIM